MQTRLTSERSPLQQIKTRLEAACQLRQPCLMLNLNPLRERLNGLFSPFVIHLTDGRKFEVPHRDFIAVGKGVVSIVDEEDCTYTIDALHIVNISDRPAKRTKPAR